MNFADAFDQSKGVAKFVMHRLGAVADDTEAAAFLRAFETERGKNDMSVSL